MSESEQSTPQSQVQVDVRAYLDRGDAYGWFDEVYQQANGDGHAVPWSSMTPRPALADWLAHAPRLAQPQRALVVACGLGDDAEALAALGYKVTAFDVAPTAIEWCKERFPDTTVDYQVADLFALPAEWQGAFDFILENFTVQALPIHMRQQSIEQITPLVAPGGELLVVCIGAPEDAERTGPPWPLTRIELNHFQWDGLTETKFETHPPAGNLSSPIWRVEYGRKK